MVMPLPAKEKIKVQGKKLKGIVWHDCQSRKLSQRFNKYLDDYIGELETVPALNDRHRGSLFCRLETLGLVKAAFNSFVKEIENEQA